MSKLLLHVQCEAHLTLAREWAPGPPILRSFISPEVSCCFIVESLLKKISVHVELDLAVRSGKPPGSLAGQPFSQPAGRPANQLIRPSIHGMCIGMYLKEIHSTGMAASVEKQFVFANT